MPDRVKRLFDTHGSKPRPELSTDSFKGVEILVADFYRDVQLKADVTEKGFPARC
jgi:hypothetical protein